LTVKDQDKDKDLCLKDLNFVLKDSLKTRTTTLHKFSTESNNKIIQYTIATAQ